MRTTLFRLSRLCALLLPAICAITPSAVAQEVIARDVYIDSHLVTVDDVEFLRDAARLTSEQMEAATTLLTGCRERLAAAQRRQERADRKWREIEDEEVRDKEYRRLMEKYVEDCATAEQEFMSDLKSLLTDGQQDAWRRFERARRRLLIRNTVNLERIDLVSILRNAGGDDGKNPEMASAIEQYEQEMDLLVQQRRPLAKALGRSTYGWLNRRDEDPKADADCRAVAARIMELHARTARAFAQLLPEEKRDVFDTRYIRAIWGETLPHFLRDEEVAEVLRVRSLSKDQRERVKEITTKAENELLQACRARMSRWEQQTIANLRNESYQDDGENFYETHILKTYKAVRKEAFDVLTPAQREAFENGEDPLDGPGPEEPDKDRRPDEY